MPEILALLQNIGPLLEKTTLRQVSQVIFGMLVSSGRITMLGLSRDPVWSVHIAALLLRNSVPLQRIFDRTSGVLR